jgi:hypothetical protein
MVTACERKAFESLGRQSSITPPWAFLVAPALLPPLSEPNMRLALPSHSSQLFKAGPCHKDLRALFKVMGRTQPSVVQLVPGNPDYIGFMMLTEYGAGGCWLAGRKILRPIVWRVEWPPG